MESQTTGSGGIAAGNIDIRTRGGSTVYDRITAGGNRSLSCRFKVPNGYTGYTLGWNGSSVNTNSELRLRATIDTYSGSIVDNHHFIDTNYVGKDTNYVYSNHPWVKIAQLGEIKVSCIPDKTISALYVSCAIKFALISNT